MITDVFKTLKDKSCTPEGLKNDILKDIGNIIKNDKSFFGALLQTGELLRMTLSENKNQTESEIKESQIICVNIIYTILKAFESSGFIKIYPKTERMANNAIEDYKKTL